MPDMKRREFITLISGTAAAWPLGAHAQQPTKMLRVGALSAQPRAAPIWLAFEQRMAERDVAQAQAPVPEQDPLVVELAARPIAHHDLAELGVKVLLVEPARVDVCA